jgi:hypothetical protein
VQLRLAGVDRLGGGGLHGVILFAVGRLFWHTTPRLRLGSDQFGGKLLGDHLCLPFGFNRCITFRRCPSAFVSGQHAHSLVLASLHGHAGEERGDHEDQDHQGSEAELRGAFHPASMALAGAGRKLRDAGVLRASRAVVACCHHARLVSIPSAAVCGLCRSGVGHKQSRPTNHRVKPGWRIVGPPGDRRIVLDDEER